MRVNVLNRMVVAVGIGAVALFGLNVQTSAQPPPQQDQKRQDEQKATNQQSAEKPAQQQLDKQQQQAQKKHEQEQQGRLTQQRQTQRLAPQDQQERIGQQRQRLAQYRDHLSQQQPLARQQSAQLLQQNRKAQYNVQQQYAVRLGQQQQLVQVQNEGRYNYGRDPYFYTPLTYRYSRGGRYYETNQYGVELLRQAVNYGYEQGCRAGLADRQDRWESNYEGSYAYQDANYGYTGFYVDRDDYNNYFREGFRRGYEDGYNGRDRYGDGRDTILGAVLGTILNFESIR